VINEKRRLSIGGTPGLRVVQAVFGLVFAAIGSTFVLLPLVADGLLRRWTGADEGCTFEGDISSLPPGFPDCASPDVGWFGNGGIGPARFIGLCGVPFVLIGLYLAVKGLRTAVWLDGTQISVRGALGTRTVDLATAEITAGATTVRQERSVGPDRIHRLPTIVARDPGSGRRVEIPLYQAGSAQLPPPELRALAEAMTRNRPSGGDNGDVHNLARQVRTMAENPLGL
jgi:hypothetical protein